MLSAWDQSVLGLGDITQDGDMVSNAPAVLRKTNLDPVSLSNCMHRYLFFLIFNMRPELFLAAFPEATTS